MISEVWIAIAVSIGVLAFAAVMLLYVNKAPGRRLMEKIAREFDCDHDQPYRFRDRYYVSFKRQDVSFFASSFLLRGCQNLRVVSIWKEPSLRVRLFADRLPAGEKNFMALEDIEIGNPAFDRAYVVNSNYPQRLQQLLTPQVQRLIQDLGLNVALNIAGNRIQLDFWIPNQEANLLAHRAVEVINQFMQIYFGMRGVPYDGDLALTPEELAMNLIEKQNSTCMICGERNESSLHKVVECATCHSRHHEECWEYLGGCATFACGETRTRVLSRN